MIVEKYNPNTLSVSAILGLIKSGDIAIPEIQRPFVWKKTQVRDLLDSLYKGYPTGYLIIWKNPNVKLKDGRISSGKKILIDGQQRVTALMTAVAGIYVINSNYKKDRIKIAFNPFAALSEDKDLYSLLCSFADIFIFKLMLDFLLIFGYNTIVSYFGR